MRSQFNGGLEEKVEEEGRVNSLAPDSNGSKTPKKHVRVRRRKCGREEGKEHRVWAAKYYILLFRREIVRLFSLVLALTLW